MTKFEIPNYPPTHSLYDFELLHDLREPTSSLGLGSYSTVKLAREKKSGRLVALKLIEIGQGKMTKNELNNLKVEINIHKELNHPNIIQFFGYILDEEESLVYLILEYAEKGNLWKYLQRKEFLTDKEVFRFFHQSCQAIKHLHDHNIVHRDIKPENLLLDKDLNIKICDFGWSAYNIMEKRKVICGTYEYMAPEIVNNEGYDYRVDIWALGILLYEMIHKKAPYFARSIHEIKIALSRTDLVFDSDIQPDIQMLIRRILEHNPEDRIPIDEILVHPWIIYQKEKEEEFRRRAYEQDAFENRNRIGSKMKKFTIFDKHSNPNDGVSHISDINSVSAQRNYIAPSYTKNYTVTENNQNTSKNNYSFKRPGILGGLNSVDMNIKKPEKVEVPTRPAFKVAITKYEHSFDREVVTNPVSNNENNKTIIGLEEEEIRPNPLNQLKRGIFAGSIVGTGTTGGGNKYYEKINKWVEVTSPQKKAPNHQEEEQQEQEFCATEEEFTTAEGAVGDRKPLNSIPMKFLSKNHKQGLARSNLLNFSENIKKSILASPVQEAKRKPKFFPEEYYSYTGNPLQNVSPNRKDYCSNENSQIVYHL